MSSIQITGIEKATVYPTNARQSYTFKRGNPVLNLQISPDAGRLLDTKSLRLNFVLNVVQDVTINGDNPSRVNNQDLRGGGAVTCFMDSRVGCNAVIDSVRLSNFKGEVISDVRNYGRMLASTLSTQTSLESYQNWGSCKNLAFAREDTQGLALNGAMTCSVPIRTGLMNAGSAISTSALSGVNFAFTLAPDNMVLYGAGAAACHYEISKVSMSFNWLTLSAPLPMKNETLQYPTYTSFVNIIASSDDQQSLMMNLQSVRSAWANMIKTSHINTFGHNSFETNRLQDASNDDMKINTYTTMKNNIKFPRKYDINERITVTNGAYEAQLGREFLGCFAPYNRMVSTLQSPVTQLYKSTTAGSYNEPDKKYVGGVGTSYDPMWTGAGTDFKQNLYTLRVQSKLQDSTANTTFTFALANSGLNVQGSDVQPIS